VSEIDFEDVDDVDRLFRLLNAGESSGGVCQFRDWEVLREIERQQRRREYDRERTKQLVLTRKYIDEHPEVAQRVAKEHGLHVEG